MLKRIKRIPRKYLIIFGIVILAVAVWFFFIRSTGTATTYVYGKVKTGEISVEVTGTGQISASNEIALTSKASGKVTALPVAVGDEVINGTLLMQIDARDAYVDLENARIAYQKLVQPADTVSTMQAENALDSATQNAKAAEADIYTAYDSGFNELTSVFLDVPTILSDLEDALGSGNYISESSARSVNETALAYRTQAENNYYNANRMYTANSKIFQALTRQSATSSIENMLSDTYRTVQVLSEALKGAKSTADYIKSKSAQNDARAYEDITTSLDSWTSTTNSHLTSLSSAISKIQSAKTTLESSRRTLAEKKESLFDLENGPDELDLRSQTLSLQQKEIAYADAFVRAPFDGILAKLNVKVGDDVSNGTSIGTFITKQKIATISLNEIDAAKIRTGQKVSLTVDAIDGLKIDGTVSEVDLVGTVSQGVVTYNVKIALNTQDTRIRSGMSISATVVTDSKTGVLVIPNAAIKNDSVQTRTGMVKIKTGLSNDTLTEVIEGLKEGDEVVTKTVLGTATAAKATPSILGNVRSAGATGGANRAR